MDWPEPTEGQGARLTAEQALAIRDKWARFLEDMAAEEVTEAIDALAEECGRLRHRLELMAKAWHSTLAYRHVGDFETCTDLVCIQNREPRQGIADGGV